MANIFAVENSQELMTALASASGGDTIELAAGSYGDLKLWDGWYDFIKYDSPVTITSADVGNLASFSEVTINGGKNITFDSVVFDYEFDPADSIKHRPFEIKNSEDITLENSVFLGDAAEGVSEIRDGFGAAFGLSVQNSSNIIVENNEFKTWSHGAIFSDIDGLVVRDNDVHDIRSDGFDFVSVRSVIIENNYLHDFRDHVDSTSHRDFIQFWTNGTDVPSTDIIIRGNILDIGEGSWAQSIFMRNEEVDTGRAGEEMFYQNVLIENNVIYNAHGHGITVGATEGLSILNNTVLRAEGVMHGLAGTATIPKINVKSDSLNVLIQDNIAGAITGMDGQPDWAIGGNVLVQPSDYLDYFFTSSLTNLGGAHNFLALPDGIIENLRAGASNTLLDSSPEEILPIFNVKSSIDDSYALIFDAGFTLGPMGLISGDEADFLWRFGDGTIAEGPLVKHKFLDAGYYEVNLQVNLKDGTTAQVNYEVGISGDDILSFDQKSGQFQTLDYGAGLLLETNAKSLLEIDDGIAIKLGGDGLQASVNRSHLSKLAGTDNFELSMTLMADPFGEPWGEVVRFHESFVIYVSQSGNLILNLFPQDGSRPQLVSEGVSLNDGASHDITILYDGVEGEVQILIDGTPNSSKIVTGTLGGGGWDLMFGNPGGKKGFEGELSAFSLSAESLDFPVYDGITEPLDSFVPGDTNVVEPELEDVEGSAPVENDEIDDEEPLDTGGVPEEDSGNLGPLLLGGYELDFAAIETSNTIKLHDDAHLIETAKGLALSYDGKGDAVTLGRLTEFEASQRIAFAVEFTNDGTDGGGQRLVWNHMKVGLTLKGDGVHVHIGNEETSFSKGFKVDGLGLNDGKQHSALVMVDAETDQLQVVIDDVLVFEEKETDFDFVNAGGREWGWSLGTEWKHFFEGEVHSFQVTDDFNFVEQAPVLEDAFLVM